ncbi:MAG TPA: hypothetical protein VLJ79_30380 [Candidatus Binatia bacterium]|nr:hypothetical protein [Candidatus Binatia bacterium]
MSARSFVSLRPSASRDSYDALSGAVPLTAYEVPGWLPGGQLQTIYAYYLKQTPNFMYRRERWETPDRALPTRAEVAEAVALEYPESGGHLGFVSGRFPGQLNWFSRRILSFLADVR